MAGGQLRELPADAPQAGLRHLGSAFTADGPVAIAEIREQYADLLAMDPFVHRGKRATTDAEKDNAVKEEFCRPLARQFQVSPEAMRIRLETLKLIVNEKPKMLF